MIVLDTSNVTARLVMSTDAERRWLTEYLTFDRVGFRGKKSAAQKERLFNVLAASFPAGLVPMISKAAREARDENGAPLNYQVSVRAKPTAPCEPELAADLSWLRDYQLEAVEAVQRQHRGILWLPTGAGKTECAVGLTLRLPCRWLFLVHRTNLAEQAAERYRLRTGLEPGKFFEGHVEVAPDTRFVCASFQSLHAALHAGGEKQRIAEHLLGTWAQGLIVDECHTLPAASFWQVSSRTANAFYRVGLSGTPLARGDQRSIYAVAALGPVIYRVRTSLLVERGVLAKPTVRLATVTQTTHRRTWAEVYSECIVKSQRRNAEVVELVRRAAKPCLVFVQEIAHGKILEKELGKAGITCAFVWGEHSLAWRNSHVRRLVQGAFDALICSVVFQEGVDIPALRSVVVAGGGKSIIATLQRLGRGMRVDRTASGDVQEGGDVFEVWDIADRGIGMLSRHTDDRIKAYTREEHETLVEQERLVLAPRP